MGPLSTFFSRNWTLKLSALGLALLLWISVRVEAPNRQEISGVPVRVDLADPTWALTDPPTPASVRVRFGGPSRELFRMAMDRPSLVIPMDQVLTGDTTIVLRNQWVRVQDRPGVVVEDIQPPTVSLVFEPIERVGLPPSAGFTGSLPDGLALSRPPSAVPNEIRVAGPRSRILGMDSVPLLPIDLSQVSASGSVSVGVDLTGLDGLQVQPASAEVELQVEERVERVVSGIPVRVTDMDEELAASPETAAVRLFGARSLLEGLDPTRLGLVVVVTDDREWPDPGEEAEYPLQVEGLPPLVEGVAEPEEVTVARLGSDPEGDPEGEDDPAGGPGR